MSLLIMVTSAVGISAEDLIIKAENSEFLELDNDFVSKVEKVSSIGFVSKSIYRTNTSDIAYKYYSRKLDQYFYIVESESKNTIYDDDKKELISLGITEEIKTVENLNNESFDNAISFFANYNVWIKTPVLARNFSNVFSNYETLWKDLAIGTITTLLFKSKGTGLAYCAFSAIATYIYRDRVKSFGLVHILIKLVIWRKKHLQDFTKMRLEQT